MRRLLFSFALLIALGPLLAHAGPRVFKANVTWYQSAPFISQPYTSNAAFVTAWFDSRKEEMSANFAPDAFFYENVTDNPFLACAPAGTWGLQVSDSFYGGLTSADVSDTLAQLVPKIAPETVVHHFKSSDCGMAIDGIASVEAAARARRLYIVIPTKAGWLRGQLWPEELLSIDSLGRRRFLAEAKMSDQQQLLPFYRLSSPNLTVNLSFNEGLGSAWYSVPNFGTLPDALSVGLHCAPAGENGPLFATLLASAGTLTNGDIVPISGDEVCGVNINNLASVLEALLQGRLYAVLYTAGNPYGEQRGQFEHIVRNDDF